MQYKFIVEIVNSDMDILKESKIKVEGKGNLNISENFNIIKSNLGEYIIEKTSQISNSDLIKEITMQKYDIESFLEIQPSINDIFLEIVEESNNE